MIHAERLAPAYFERGALRHRGFHINMQKLLYVEERLMICRKQ